MTDKTRDIQTIDEVILELKAQFVRATDGNNWTAKAETAKAIALLFTARAAVSESPNYNSTAMEQATIPQETGRRLPPGP